MRHFKGVATIISVRKRNGDVVDFNADKIKQAILKAMRVSGKIDKSVAGHIADDIANKYIGVTKPVRISDIETDVFNYLIKYGREDIAKLYEGYRAIREYQRKISDGTESKILEMLDNESEYWSSENSNKNADLVTTKRDYMAGIISKDIAKKYIFSPDVVQADAEAVIKIHDLDYASQHLTNCELCNLDDMLQNGTCINGVHKDKPHRLLTATTIATQIITQVTSSSYGGCTITLTHLAPFVRDSYNYYISKYKAWGLCEKDVYAFAMKDLKKEITDSVQTFNYQLNSMTNSNGQSPFLSLYMDINENPEYIKEVAMLIEEFLNQRIIGMKNKTGHYVTPAFPKLLYTLDENNVYEDSEYYYLTELAAKCTAKRMVPDYISAKMMRKLKGAVYPCMGCRSFLTPDRTIENIAKSNNWIKGKKYYGRFNLGVVTLNLVDIALSSGGDFGAFWEIFEERAELCHKAHKERINYLKGTKAGEAPIMWVDGALARLNPDETIDKLFYNGYATCSLGYAGLYECVKYMTGKSQFEDDGKIFGLSVMQKLNDKCSQWKREENIDYSLYGTPMESGTYKFAQALQRRFGIIDGITDRNYITNSYHHWVRDKVDPFTKLTDEAEYQALSPGGAISYTECSDLLNNIPAVLTIIKHIYDNIMYAELNTKSDYCQICDYDGEMEIIDTNGVLGWKCPNCGNTDTSKMNISRRVCGYLSTNLFNQGRTQEIKERYVHLDNHEVTI